MTEYNFLKVCIIRKNEIDPLFSSGAAKMVAALRKSDLFCRHRDKQRGQECTVVRHLIMDQQFLAAFSFAAQDFVAHFQSESFHQ
jgi:hypothetical protein